MATTTNYSWTTPDDTDLVKDGAAAIRTLGSSADTTVKNLNPGTTAGDIDYYTSSTAKARVAIGTAGQFLAVNSGATAPEWVAAPGGGKVLQVITGTTSTSVSVSSSTYTDSNLTATITPSSATSKVLIIVTQPFSIFNTATGGGAFGKARLLRDSTELAQQRDIGVSEPTGVTKNFGTSYNVVYLDSPATTSATTYKTQVAAVSGDTTFRAQNPFDTWLSSIILMEIGA